MRHWNVLVPAFASSRVSTRTPFEKASSGAGTVARTSSVARAVEAREPGARVLVLTLRPGLARLLRVALVGADEVEPAARLRRVGDRDPRLLAAGERAAELDGERLVRRREAERPPLLAHGGDAELDGVEGEPLGRT